MRWCRLVVLAQLKDYFSFTYLVAMEKWLSVWHDTGGTDNEITAKCVPIGQLDVKWPRFSWERQKLEDWKVGGTKKKKKSSNNRIGSNMSSESSSHLSRVWVFAVGNWAAPRRWRSFPPHTGIPIKLGGTPGLTPAGRRDPGEHNRRSRRMQINLHRVTSFPK